MPIMDLTFKQDKTMILIQEGNEIRLTVPQQQVLFEALRIKLSTKK